MLRCAFLFACALVAAACSSTDPLPWTDDPLRPQGLRVVGLSDIGQFSTCALTDAGLVYCWGDNIWGEFGDGTQDFRDAPTLAAGGMRFMQIDGNNFPAMCGVAEDARAWCWGMNHNGNLGDGSTELRRSPSAVAGDHRFAQISTRTHSCGVTTEGQLLCWGSTYGGVLGVGHPPGDDRLEPTPVNGGGTYTRVTTGQQFTCALRVDGSAYCWGWGAGLGSGARDRSVYEPALVSGGHHYSSISAGEAWVCALEIGGAPYCWGNTGVQGDDFRSAPRIVPTSLRFSEVVSGLEYGACALTHDGAGYCWRKLDPPVPVPGQHRWAGLARGYDSYCGYTPGGSVFCWRWREGDGTTGAGLTEPVRLNAVPPVTH